jgi:SAM-dependent methyltransferase
MSDSTRRFSSRVEDYVRYRPGYPEELISLLREECGLTSESVVADVGSGTGILSEMFLRNGNPVFGVEPNREMREAGERLLVAYPGFMSVAGTAEVTTLPNSSVDFVTAGQAFHWFDPDRAREEWLRILRPGGWAVIVWNDRRSEGTPFLEGYEALLLRYGTDYERVTHRQFDEERLRAFFGQGGCEERVFGNEQVFDFEGARGRLLSSSYTPEAGHPDYEPMLEELKRIFDAHQEDGKVRVEYDTRVYFGQLKGGEDGTGQG